MSELIKKWTWKKEKFRQISKSMFVSLYISVLERYLQWQRQPNWLKCSTSTQLSYIWDPQALRHTSGIVNSTGKMCHQKTQHTTQLHKYCILKQAQMLADLGTVDQHREQGVLKACTVYLKTCLSFQKTGCPYPWSVYFANTSRLSINTRSHQYRQGCYMSVMLSGPSLHEPGKQ